MIVDKSKLQEKIPGKTKIQSKPKKSNQSNNNIKQLQVIEFKYTDKKQDSNCKSDERMNEKFNSVETEAKKIVPLDKNQEYYIKNKKINLNWKQVFYIAFCPKKAEKDTNQEIINYHIGLQKVFNMFDVKRLMRTLNEFEMLKKICLNDDQQRVFKLITKTYNWNDLRFSTDGDIGENERVFINKETTRAFFKIKDQSDSVSANINKLIDPSVLELLSN